VRDPGREEPQVALAHVVDEVTPVRGEGRDPGAAGGHVRPLGLFVPVQLAHGARLERPVDARERRRDAQGRALAHRGFPARRRRERHGVGLIDTEQLGQPIVGHGLPLRGSTSKSPSNFHARPSLRSTSSRPSEIDVARTAPRHRSSPQRLSGLAKGTHTFSIAATDGVGNSSQLTRTWTVSSSDSGGLDTQAAGAPVTAAAPLTTLLTVRTARAATLATRGRPLRIDPPVGTRVVRVCLIRGQSTGSGPRAERRQGRSTACWPRRTPGAPAARRRALATPACGRGRPRRGRGAAPAARPERRRRTTRRWRRGAGGDERHRAGEREQQAAADERDRRAHAAEDRLGALRAAGDLIADEVRIQRAVGLVGDVVRGEQDAEREGGVPDARREPERGDPDGQGRRGAHDEGQPPFDARPKPVRPRSASVGTKSAISPSAPDQQAGDDSRGANDDASSGSTS
jgi:hypothetical protein